MLALLVAIALFIGLALVVLQLQGDFGAPHDDYRASTPAALSLRHRRFTRPSTRARAR